MEHSAAEIKGLSRMISLPFGFLTPFPHRAFLGACVSRMIDDCSKKNVLVHITASADDLISANILGARQSGFPRKAAREG
jgi:hypothetical protein